MTTTSGLAGGAHTFQIISSLRFDPDLPSAVAQSSGQRYPEPHNSPYYLLQYHHDRLLDAAVQFRWHNAVRILDQDLEIFTQLLDPFIPDRNKAWRLRIVVDADGHFSVDVHPASPWALQCMFLPVSFDAHAAFSSTFPWRLLIDTERTKPSIFTTHKTTSRDHYNAARERAGIRSPMDPLEVVLVNSEGEVMEGSITTVYFRERQWSEGRAGWITPSLRSGGMISTSRRLALEQGFCTERVIRVEELVHGEQCFLSNAVRGFIPAVLDLKTQ